MVMQHSRSRLAEKPVGTFFTGKVAQQFLDHSQRFQQHFSTVKPFSPVLKEYLKHWPQLAIGLSVFFVLYRLISSYTPSQLAHFLIPNSYLSVLSLFFIGGWYCWSFLLHGTKKSLIASLICTLWLFTRLQQIITPNWFWICLLFGWIAIGFTRDLLKHKRV